jgi:hypothetical protein
LVVSDTDVATTFTVLPVGIAAGAVYVVAALLAVVVGLNVPHAEVPQVTLHVTPAFLLSPATTAVSGKVLLIVSAAGGVAANETLTPAGAAIVIVAVAVAVPSVTELATMFTVPPVGTFAGAVYVVAVPLAVVAGVKVPHEELPQVTDHVTPPLLLSLLTTAVSDAVAPAVIEVGGAGLRLTEIAGGFGPLPPPPPQAAAANATAAMLDIKIVLSLGNFTAHLP